MPRDTVVHYLEGVGIAQIFTACGQIAHNTNTGWKPGGFIGLSTKSFQPSTGIDPLMTIHPEYVTCPDCLKEMAKGFPAVNEAERKGKEV